MAVGRSTGVVFYRGGPLSGLAGGRLHVVEFYGKCIGKYTIHGWYGKG